MHSSHPLIVATLALAMLTPASSALAATETFNVITDPTWLSIGPIGDLSGTPIGSVGADFENNNIGWNSLLDYDDSAWHSPAFLNTNYSGLGYIGIWSTVFDPSPTYYRKKFAIDGVPVSGTLKFGADDDALVFVNGNLVATDTNGLAGPTIEVDISEQLIPGMNLIAVKAHDSAGANQWLELRASIVTQPVPEPETYALMLAGLGLLGFVARRRKSA